jgi:Predicted membrane protein
VGILDNIKGNLNEYGTHEGRITRRTYILRVVGRWIAEIVFGIWAALLMFLIYILALLISSEPMIGAVLATPIVFAFSIIFFFLKLVQEMKRLHDMNSSGWGVIFGFIPLVNIIYYLLLILSDGTVGPNRYGEDPKGRKRNE